jgi:hypothetical protein
MYGWSDAEWLTLQLGPVWVISALMGRHTAWPCTCRRAVVLEGETLQRSASVEYSLVKAERLSPYESLWVDSPEALADSAGSASTSI